MKWNPGKIPRIDGQGVRMSLAQRGTGTVAALLPGLQHVDESLVMQEGRGLKMSWIENPGRSE
jgi:hypothetical protein